MTQFVDKAVGTLVGRNVGNIVGYTLWGTRAACVAGEHSTTEPPMQMMVILYYKSTNYTSNVLGHS